VISTPGVPVGSVAAAFSDRRGRRRRRRRGGGGGGGALWGGHGGGGQGGRGSGSCDGATDAVTQGGTEHPPADRAPDDRARTLTVRRIAGVVQRNTGGDATGRAPDEGAGRPRDPPPPVGG